MASIFSFCEDKKVVKNGLENFLGDFSSNMEISQNSLFLSVEELLVYNRESRLDISDLFDKEQHLYAEFPGLTEFYNIQLLEKDKKKNPKKNCYKQNYLSFVWNRFYLLTSWFLKGFINL